MGFFRVEGPASELENSGCIGSLGFSASGFRVAFGCGYRGLGC